MCGHTGGRCQSCASSDLPGLISPSSAPRKGIWGGLAVAEQLKSFLSPFSCCQGPPPHPALPPQPGISQPHAFPISEKQAEGWCL